MTAVHGSPEARSRGGHGAHGERLGVTIWRLAGEYAAGVNRSPFFTTLRSGRLSRRRYVAFITGMYPVVVGFNRALIRSIGKVDHVRQSGFVKHLAEQLREEQDHNEIWRRKLEGYGVDHEQLYATLRDYMGRFELQDLDRMTAEVLGSVTDGGASLGPDCFPDSVFPEPVLALYHHLWMTASYDGIDYWEHFASQSCMEVMIYDVVSTSIYPGVSGRAHLDGGPAAMRWWQEHARQGSIESGRAIDEERHLELSKLALDRKTVNDTVRAQIVSRAQDTMRLFAAAMMCQDFASKSFPLEHYLVS
ncbi:MAG: hypothetical protein ACRENI_12665 [Gemmatimonadaceae bacterium]